MNIKTLDNFNAYLDNVEEYSQNEYQLDIVSDYRNYLTNHNDHFTLEMYRKIKQLSYQVDLQKAL